MNCTVSISIILTGHDQASAVGKHLARVRSLLPVDLSVEIVVTGQEAADTTEDLATASPLPILLPKVASSLHHVLRCTSGNLLVFLDCDTVPTRCWLDALLSGQKAYPNHVVFCGSAQPVPPDHRSLWFEVCPMGNVTLTQNALVNKSGSLNQNCLPLFQNLAIRRWALEELLGPERPKFARRSADPPLDESLLLNKLRERFSSLHRNQVIAFLPDFAAECRSPSLKRIAEVFFLLGVGAVSLRQSLGYDASPSSFLDLSSLSRHGGVVSGIAAELNYYCGQLYELSSRGLVSDAHMLREWLMRNANIDFNALLCARANRLWTLPFDEPRSASAIRSCTFSNRQLVM